MAEAEIAGSSTHDMDAAPTRIGIIGAGYVGLVTSACLASLGHRVTCLDIDAEKIASLRRGVLPIFEPDLQELVDRGMEDGLLRFSTSYEETFSDAQIAIVAVNTPPDVDGSADTSFVRRALGSLIEVGTTNLLIAIKSTVPVGTCDSLQEMVAPHGHSIVSHPEFLRQGTAVRDFLKPDRIVVGGDDVEQTERILALYSSIEAPKVVCSLRSAELAKYVSNASLAVRISFINEIAAICDSVGADINTVASIVGMDHRIGPHYLKAGLGWGGSCLPKDVMALASMADIHGHEPHVLRAATTVNHRQPLHAVESVISAGNLAPGSRVAVLGISFKPNTDDTRHSPAVLIVKELLSAGMTVQAHDPAALKHLSRLHPEVVLCDDPYAACEGAHAVLLATEWDDYLNLDWERLRELMLGTVVYDGRGVLDAPYVRSLGFQFLGPGRHTALANEGLLV